LARNARLSAEYSQKYLQKPANSRKLSSTREDGFPMAKKIAIALAAAFFFLGLSVLVLNRLHVDFGLAKIGRYFQDRGIEIEPRADKEFPLRAETPLKETASGIWASAKKEKAAIKLCVKAESAPAQDKILINEVAWMGNFQSYADEWIELKNISGETVAMGGWQLQNKKQKIKAVFGEDAVVAPGGLFLMERTDDGCVPDAAADLIYTGSLGNKNEALYLFDNNCRLQDSVEALVKWPAGDNGTKQTMERTENLLWQTSSEAGGTPKKNNSRGLKSVTASEISGFSK
jgi:hypothetical protein